MSGTLQLWGTGSGLTNVSSMIDAYVIYDELKVQNYEDKKAAITNKKKAWDDIKSSMEKLDKMIDKLSGTDKVNYKTANLSSTTGLEIKVGAKAENLSYTMSVEQLATAHTVAGNKVDSVSESLNLKGEFKINGATISIEDTDSLTDVVKKINSANNNDCKCIGARAYVIDGTLFIDSSETGVDHSLQFEDTDGVLASLGIIKEDGSVNTTKEASNAILNINGVKVERGTNTINDAINGLDITLTSVTTTPITVKIEENKEDITALAKELVDVLNEISTKMSKYTAYSEGSGGAILNGDSSVSSIKSLLTQTLQKPGNTGGTFSYLFDIGISSDRFGKFNLDESKLEKALSQDPESVVSLLTGGLDVPGTKPGDKNAGIFVNLKSAVNDIIGGTSNMLSSKYEGYDSQIKTYEKLITKQKAYVESRRALLSKQFTAMETAMSSYNNQLSYFANLNNLNSNK